MHVYRVCMFVFGCLYLGLFVSIHLCVSVCLHSESTVRLKEVNVQLHSSLSFIDSQYVLVPG